MRVTSATTRPKRLVAERQPRDGTLLHSAVGGLFAGLVFGVGQMMISLGLGRPLSRSLNLAGSSMFSQGAMRAGESVLPVVGAFVAHFALSILFALVFFSLVGSTWRAGAVSSTMIFLGITYGIALWIVNMVLIAPLFFPRPSNVHQGWDGFFAHTFLYGVVLGLYAAVIPRAPQRVTL